MDIVSVSKLFFVLLVFFVFAAPIFLSEALGADGESVEASAVDGAEAALASAYEAVLDAEQAGANVSGLLIRLNVAGEYLASAHIWRRLGDFENATRFANLCYDIGKEVTNEAHELKNEAHGLWVRDFWLMVTMSVVGVVSVGFLSFLVWRAFKRRYHRRVLEMRPGAVSGES